MKRPSSASYVAINVLLSSLCVSGMIVVGAAEVVTDGQAWTHKDTAFSGAASAKENRNVQISPRMDFEEWTPLGRGDPLKNDPTFDYLPPVLDKVHYWKAPPTPAHAAVRASSTVASAVPPPLQAVTYNRRFFLTDFSSKKEPAAAAVYAQQQYLHKRPQLMAATITGYHYPMPRVPLPMLTPPPYQRPTPPPPPPQATTAVQVDAGNSAAESKQPPAVRAPPPATLQLHLHQQHQHQQPTMMQPGVRPPPPPPMHHSAAAIKVLLENEVDRTTVTTTGPTVTAAAAAATTGTSPAAARFTTAAGGARAPPTTDPLFAHYKQSAVMVTGRPMYLIIQGHSKVKTYGSVNKSDDLTIAAQPTATQEHNHIGNRPDGDDQSRRKRNGQLERMQ